MQCFINEEKCGEMLIGFPLGKPLRTCRGPDIAIQILEGVCGNFQGLPKFVVNITAILPIIES